MGDSKFLFILVPAPVQLKDAKSSRERKGIRMNRLCMMIDGDDLAL